MAAARWPPRRAKFCSAPLRVAVRITRLGPLRALMNGALELAQLMMAKGRSWSFSQSASSAALRSGPRRLNFAVFPSKVPCPIITSQSGSAEFFGCASRSAFSFALFETCCSSASPCSAAAAHWSDHFLKSPPYSSVPGAPLMMTSVGAALVISEKSRVVRMAVRKIMGVLSSGAGTIRPQSRPVPAGKGWDDARQACGY